MCDPVAAIVRVKVRVEIKNNEGKDITILIGKSIDSYTDKEVPILYKDDNQVAYISYDNIYFVGDGAGKAGNIVVAAATGLIAARDILKNSK